MSDTTPGAHASDAQPDPLTIERRDGWTTVTHSTGGVVLRTTDHASATAYADRLAPRKDRP